jgi:hypothetical protein
VQDCLVDRAIARIIEPCADRDACAHAPPRLSEASLARRLDDLADTQEGCTRWRSSLPALMQVLDMEATLGWRERLVSELHCPTGVSRQAQQDWLLQALLRRLRGA